MPREEDPILVAAKQRRMAWEYLTEPSRWVYTEPVSTRMEELAPIVEEIEEGIIEALRPVLNRTATMMLVDADTYKAPDMVASFRKVAHSWAVSLVDVGNPEGSLVARHIVTVAFGEKIPPRFWLTHLGQLVFFRDGFPDRKISRTEARFILGGITRQAVDFATYPDRAAPDRILINADLKAPLDDARTPRFLTRDSVYRRWNGLKRLQEEKMLAKIREIDIPGGL